MRIKKQADKLPDIPKNINWLNLNVLLHNYFDKIYQKKSNITPNKPSPTIKEELTTMSIPSKKVTLRTYYGDKNLEETSTEVIFGYMREIKKSITSLEVVADDSKAAKNQITQLKDTIKQLAMYVDTREPKND